MRTQTLRALAAALLVAACGSGGGGNTGGGSGGSGGSTAGGSGGGTGGSAAGGTGGSSGAVTYSVKLTQSQQVPAVTAPPSRSGSGTVVVTALADGGYTAKIAVTHDIPSGDVVNGHLHYGWAGFNSADTDTVPVVTSPIDQTIAISAGRAADIAAGRAYLNVHTADNPNGEIRGQLVLPAEDLYLARVNGAQQVPLAIHPGSGVIGVIIDRTTGAAKYEASWSANVVATAAHLHQGGPGVDGPVVLGFAVDGGTRVWGGGMISGWPADGGYYFNVHTADGGGTGGGLIRGNLIKQ
ncbi:MAG: CHRD domain-containing protein [Archangiaceae bacterium]|nr:CHRD domain-containing protein [Archangiaceae bacterium]